MTRVMRQIAGAMCQLQILVRTVALCGAGTVFASIGTAGPRYTDLRTIEPIHGNAAAGATKAAVCFACHGADGVSIAPTFPRLAGQRADYLYHRLVSFARSDAKDPYYSVSPMTSIATGLSDADMRNLATYFAGQTPRVPQAPAAAPAAPATDAAATLHAGEALFLHGDAARGIPPCQGCHGEDARGPSSVRDQYAAYPSLRGQYATYVMARLGNFRKGLPSDTSNSFIMHGVAETLDDGSIDAIAAWLGSLQ
jgi:cytochrome c553